MINSTNSVSSFLLLILSYSDFCANDTIGPIIITFVFPCTGRCFLHEIQIHSQENENQTKTHLYATLSCIHQNENENENIFVQSIKNNDSRIARSYVTAR